MTNNNGVNPKVSLPLLIALIVFGISLIIALNIIFLSDKSRQITMGSEQSETFSVFDNKLTFIIGQSTNFTHVYIYGIGENETNITLSSSILIDSTSGKSIELKFDGNKSININNTGINPRVSEISVSPIESGVYHGAIFVVNHAHAMVPFTVDIKPNITQPLILVVDGIVISIALWKLIKFYNERYNAIVINNAIVSSKPNTPRGLATYFRDKDATNGIILKNAILDLGTIIFGIALGIFTLFNDSFILGVHSLGIFDVITLIGMGLGLGSLKEFITKA